MICDIKYCKKEGKIHIHNVPRIIMATCFDEITERKKTTYLLFSCIINNVSFKGLQEATHDRSLTFKSLRENMNKIRERVKLEDKTRKSLVGIDSQIPCLHTPPCVTTFKWIVICKLL